jgi:hypothetical protein
MVDRIEELINRGKTFTFAQNSYRAVTGFYSKASPELLGWVGSVEEFILQNYGEDSGPYRLYKNFKIRELNGFEQGDFEKQIRILLGSLISCKESISNQLPKKRNSHFSMLIKNAIFWTVLLSIIGGAFLLGLYFGNNKFDKDKSDFYDSNRRLINESINLKKSISTKDSIISVDNTRIKHLTDSILINKRTLK